MKNHYPGQQAATTTFNVKFTASLHALNNNSNDTFVLEPRANVFLKSLKKRKNKKHKKGFPEGLAKSCITHDIS